MDEKRSCKKAIYWKDNRGVSIWSCNHGIHKIYILWEHEHRNTGK